MGRAVRRLLPFTTAWGAAAFAWHHRRPLWDWTRWTVGAVPRVVDGQGGEVWDEAKARARGDAAAGTAPPTADGAPAGRTTA